MRYFIVCCYLIILAIVNFIYLECFSKKKIKGKKWGHIIGHDYKIIHYIVPLSDFLQLSSK